jgi:hypothetical protein
VAYDPSIGSQCPLAARLSSANFTWHLLNNLLNLLARSSLHLGTKYKLNEKRIGMTLQETMVWNWFLGSQHRIVL